MSGDGAVLIGDGGVASAHLAAETWRKHWIIDDMYQAGTTLSWAADQQDGAMRLSVPFLNVYAFSSNGVRYAFGTSADLTGRRMTARVKVVSPSVLPGCVFYAGIHLDSRGSASFSSSVGGQDVELTEGEWSVVTLDVYPLDRADRVGNEIAVRISRRCDLNEAGVPPYAGPTIITIDDVSLACN